MPQAQRLMKIGHANVVYDDKQDHLHDPAYPTHHAYGRYELRERGHELFLAPEGESGKFAQLWNKPRLLGDWDKQRYFWKHRHEMDAIYTGHQYDLLLLGVLRRIGFFKVPIVASLHRSYGTGFVERMFVRYLLSNMDRFLTVLPPVQKAMKNAHPELADKLKLGQWGADYAAFDRIDVPVSQAERGIYFASGKTYRIYDPVIEAFTGLDAELRMYFGSLNQDAAALAQQKAYPDNINFVDFDYKPESLKRAVSNARAVLIPIQPEKLSDYANGFGFTSMLDAFIGGRPIIMSDGPHAYKELEKHGAGILVDANDPMSWRKAVEYLETNPEKAEAMAQASRELGLAAFNIERFADSIEEAMSEVVR